MSHDDASVRRRRAGPGDHFRERSNDPTTPPRNKLTRFRARVHRDADQHADDEGDDEGREADRVQLLDAIVRPIVLADDGRRERGPGGGLEVLNVAAA